MQRRKFLQLTGLGAAVLAIPGIGASVVSAEEALIGIIKNEFSYLKLDQKGLEQFAEDYFKLYANDSILKLRAKSYYLLRIDKNRSNIVNRIVHDYIKASDFFFNKMDESKPVRYVGLYNPWKRPCANPFTSSFYPETDLIS